MVTPASGWKPAPEITTGSQPSAGPAAGEIRSMRHAGTVHSKQPGQGQDDPPGGTTSTSTRRGCSPGAAGTTTSSSRLLRRRTLGAATPPKRTSGGGAIVGPNSDPKIRMVSPPTMSAVDGEMPSIRQGAGGTYRRQASQEAEALRVVTVTSTIRPPPAGGSTAWSSTGLTGITSSAGMPSKVTAGVPNRKFSAKFRVKIEMRSPPSIEPVSGVTR